MHYSLFQDKIVTNGVHVINNNSNLNIVLFGNCHVGPIGFFLNELLQHKYNIHMILGYITGKSYTDENRNKIWETIRKADYFIYQVHKADFNINASKIETYANKIKIKIPNIRLDYTDLNGNPIATNVLLNNFSKSYNVCKENIINSDFPNFLFILDFYKNIRFFNTPTHPTNYILYLLSLQISYKINNEKKLIGIGQYYQHKSDKILHQTKIIVIPFFYPYKNHECKLLGINITSEYFDRKF